MLHCLWRSSSFSSAPRRLLRLVTHSNHRPTSVFSSPSKSFTSQTIMSDKKRKSTSSAAAGGKEPSAKQQKLAPMKEEEKKERVEGWLQDLVKQQRTEKKEMKFNKKRLRFMSDTEQAKQGSEGVLYWMLRDHRVQDNWALVQAQRLALEENLPLHICVCLVVPKSELSTLRHYSFMLKGLKEVAKECKTLDIQFHLLHGSAGDVLPGFVSDRGLGTVVTDFSPLREPLQWLEDVKKTLPKDIPLIQVDAHNIVPCWVASPKLEYAARTIRGKITKLLPEFLTEFPLVEKHPYTATRTAKPVDWDKILASLQVDRAVGEPEWAKPGTNGGMAMLESFIDVRLKLFDTQRNDPNAAALSQLSPWIRFGHLSAQRVALQVQHSGKSAGHSVSSFIEELVVRRELTDNFCFYNKKYDCVEGAYEWAQKTLKDHAKDKRPYLYTREQLEKAKTHDKLWNGAQYQMVTEGKMHGFLRMYWAKKILEWTSSPEEALSIALYLNDRYELDGQDPNGFVGCMWSICGIHDQGWRERAVFGKIRYMNYKGCLRKFDVARFERKYCPKNL
ncbi:deoxyribodipyrimidine photo-lyase isoform X1 [Sander lucioperca]|uniref:Deoxyribodipyrimidine photo-lyase n=2 Tax=Sander lucioperca TaxID=283035 RepID=A0A8C9X7D8_SANLU|nr:deoxyribodipyrimidine photo-lyase isoform X1 [Sander lucioperca]XP_035861222.1 deoxyribodipyrimidine photo-lyase isoform X1 [Sander lucioperca]